ncbi:helix-turn-helix domain-containing protein [Streptomyces sp. NPDC059578]|uniref:helix-turn-helix transcriptional regulator n=1 Tax=unclassified Streptomyces TaxID=2593676 RepID=UPI0036629B17
MDDTHPEDGPPPGPPSPAIHPDDEFITPTGHPLHVHAYHQFLWVSSGEIAVNAVGEEHGLSRSVALWIPAGVPHSARFGTDSVIAVEVFYASSFRLPFRRVTTLNTTNDQRHLLLARMRSSTGPDNPDVFSALTACRANRLPLPQPTGLATTYVAQELARRPSDARTATEWAQAAYTNSTSLRRAFRAETGLPLSEWRTRLRLNHSLTLLEQGHMVSAVAAWVGFSTNGYILAFRRYFGQTPGTYVRNWENELA